MLVTPDQPRDLQLEKAAAQFVGAFECVFGQDWDYTKACLRTDILIAPDRTFIEPGQEDEAADWCNRGALLAAYRTLAAALKKRGAHPDQYNPDELN